MMFHIYHADCIGDPSNCSYPHADEITDATSLSAAVQRDYVCAETIRRILKTGFIRPMSLRRFRMWPLLSITPGIT